MSKKLLMNNYSENGLLPVMDGLIAWYDASDLRIGVDIWKDRSGNGYDIPLIYGYHTPSNNCLEIRNTIGTNINLCIPYIISNISTIQKSNKIYIKNSGSYGVLFSNQQLNADNITHVNKFKVCFRGNSRIGVYSTNVGKSFNDGFYCNQDKNLIVSYFGKILKCNDEIFNTDIELDITEYLTANVANTIFDNTIIEEDIYGILIYNRELTIEEIQINELYLKSISEY